MKAEHEQTAINCWNSGTSLADQERPNEAINEFTKAIKANPTWPLPYFWRAMMYDDLRKYSQAESDFGTFIDLGGTGSDDLLAEAYAGRAYAHKRQGNFQKAIDDYTREIDLNPKSAIGHLDRSLAYDELGDFKLARADYEKALELDSKIAELTEGRPKNWKRRGETGESTTRG